MNDVEIWCQAIMSVTFPQHVRLRIVKVVAAAGAAIFP